MRRFRGWVLASVVLGSLLTSRGWAMGPFGRFVSGGHPYHNGYLFVPPSSAYEAVRVRPPAWYGAPSYYYPHAYLAPGTTYYPYAHYPTVPAWRAGSYYLSAQGYLSVYPW